MAMFWRSVPIIYSDIITFKINESKTDMVKFSVSFDKQTEVRLAKLCPYSTTKAAGMFGRLQVEF